MVLVNPNRLQPAPAPVALDYLASELERHGADVRLLDLSHAGNVQKAISDFFAGVKADLVGISIRNLDDVVFNIFTAAEIKPIVESVKRSISCPLVLGGSGYSIAPEQALDYFGVELGVAGEGEEALVKLVDYADVPEKYCEIPGLLWRENGKIRRNPLGMADVNSFHLAKRGKVCYRDYMYKKGRRGGTGVQTKRGCSNNCIYCAVPNIEGSTVRLRDPKEIADEMENLVGLGVNRIFIADSEINHPKEHAMEICEEFIRRNFRNKLTWQAYTSPGQFDMQLAEKMKEAGCDMTFTTLDSGVDDLLERWNKPFRTKDIVQYVNACRQTGLGASYCLSIGGPGENMDTLLKTLGFVQSLKPITVTFGEPPGLRVYPNTPLAEIVREEGFSPSNPNLSGKIIGNESLLEPVYYLSSQIGALVPVIKAYRKLGELHHKLVAR